MSTTPVNNHFLDEVIEEIVIQLKHFCLDFEPEQSKKGGTWEGGLLHELEEKN